MENNNVDRGNDQGERLFTQEEVNAIVKKRLERVRAEEAGKADEETAQRLAALDQREQELNKRAQDLDRRAYLTDNGYDSDLLDIIAADDLDSFKEKADRLAGMIRSGNNAFVAPLSAESVNADPVEDDIKAAFSRSYRHTPGDTFNPTPKE